MKVFDKADTCWEVVLMQCKPRIYAPKGANVSAKEPIKHQDTYAHHRIAKGQEWLVNDAGHLPACSNDSGSGSNCIWMKCELLAE